MSSLPKILVISPSFDTHAVENPVERVQNSVRSPCLSHQNLQQTDDTAMKETLYTVKDERRAELYKAGALAEATADDLRVLVALFSLGRAGADALSKSLSLAEAAVTASLAFWRGAGIVTVIGKEEKKPSARGAQRRENTLREAGAEELAESIRTSHLSGLITAAEQQRGRLFNRTDLSILVGLSEELGLDGPYILTLLAYCDAQGDGSPKPMRYLERVALRLSEHGITTCAALEEYIRREESLRTVEGGLRRMFGIGSRKLTEREEAAFLRWTQEYGYDEEIIGAAFDVTVDATSRASVAYTEKILAHWHEAGVKTLAEAEELLTRERSARKKRSEGPKKTAEPKSRSFDANDFFNRAVERSFKADKKND